MNGYIRLFKELAKSDMSTWLPADQFQELGFFSDDFEMLHKEGFVVYKPTSVPNSVGDYYDKYYVKLAPRGFASLESYFERQEQNKINKQNLRATTIIAIATTLNVMVVLWNVLAQEKQTLWNVLALAFVGAILALLSGYLVKEVWELLSPRKKRRN